MNAPPLKIEVAPVSAVTGTGVDDWVEEPLPNCPYMLLPQHLAAPLAMSAQVWDSPAVMAVAPVSPSAQHVSGGPTGA